MENIFNNIARFYNHPLFIIVGGLTLTIAVLGLLYRIICWVFGITPVVFRLGIALWKRRIAVFGSREAYESIRSSLLDSKIFKEQNIISITLENIDKAYPNIYPKHLEIRGKFMGLIRKN